MNCSRLARFQKFFFFDSLESLNGFIKQVVVNRRDVGVRKWTNWLREDLGSRPCAWLWPEFVPPALFLVIKDPQTQSSHLIDGEFRRAWMPFSAGLVILWLLLVSSWISLGICCLRSLSLISLGLRDGICKRLLGLRSLPLRGWMVGRGMRSRRSHFLGSLGWLSCLSWLRLMVLGLRGYWLPILL